MDGATRDISVAIPGDPIFPHVPHFPASLPSRRPRRSAAPNFAARIQLPEFSCQNLAIWSANYLTRSNALSSLRSDEKIKKIWLGI